MPRQQPCGHTSIIRNCVDCDTPMECPAKTTKPRTLCDGCKLKRKTATAAKAAWGKTETARCGTCDFWFNRSAVSDEATCAPCRRGEGPKHGRNTYSRGCRCDICTAAASASRIPREEKPRELTCVTCGQPFMGMRRRKYCSDNCWIKTAPGQRKYIKGDYRKRARHHGVDYEPLDRNAVFARDGWICGICETPVDPELEYPHRKSVSLDHIVPISRGGAHTEGNVQCAHWDCNILKRDREVAA